MFKLFMRFSDENVNYARVIKIDPLTSPKLDASLPPIGREGKQDQPDRGDENRMIYRPHPIESIFADFLRTLHTFLNDLLHNNLRPITAMPFCCDVTFVGFQQRGKSSGSTAAGICHKCITATSSPFCTSADAHKIHYGAIYLSREA